jgi:hypothetical protein
MTLLSLEKKKKHITKTKLWNCCTREVFIPDFYEQSGKNLMLAFKKSTDEDDADNDQLLAKVKKQIAKISCQY